MMFRLDFLGGMIIMGLAVVSTFVAALAPSVRISRKNIAQLLSGLALALLMIAPLAHAAPAPNASAKGGTPTTSDSPADFLNLVDAVRRVPATGFVTDVTFIVLEGGKETDRMSFIVGGHAAQNIAFSTSDPAGKRMAILSTGGGMWMQAENLRRPVRLSPAQRLLGNASNADVISVLYATDYQAVEMQIKGNHRLLALNPRPDSQNAAYGKIRLVATADGRVEGGEYYTVSGKLLKKSTFTYSGGRLASALITDALRPSEQTQVLYGPMKERKFDAAFFNAQDLLTSARALPSR